MDKQEKVVLEKVSETVVKETKSIETFYDTSKLESEIASLEKTKEMYLADYNRKVESVQKVIDAKKKLLDVAKT